MTRNTASLEGTVSTKTPGDALVIAFREDSTRWSPVAAWSFVRPTATSVTLTAGHTTAVFVKVSER